MFFETLVDGRTVTVPYEDANQNRSVLNFLPQSFSAIFNRRKCESKHNIKLRT